MIFSLCCLVFFLSLRFLVDSLGDVSHVDFTDIQWKQQLRVDNNRFVVHVITSRETTLWGKHDPVVTSLDLHSNHLGLNAALGPISRTSRDLFGPEKPVVKLQSSCFEKRIF